VLSLDEVKAALLHYARTGQRAAAFAWHDVTEEQRSKNDTPDDDDEIEDITPGGAGS
jgi:hypothetical protein